jgi:hypothetical protein
MIIDSDTFPAITGTATANKLVSVLAEKRYFLSLENDIRGWKYN